MGIVDFYDTKEIDIKKALGLIDSVTTLDDEQKSKFKQILKKVIADFTKEYLSQKTQAYKSVLENLPFKKRESIEGGEIIADAVDKN